MALLTDGNPNDTEALRVYESSILDVAHVEGIDLDAKLSLATEEVSQEVLNFLLDHAAADPVGSGRRAEGVADVVVTAQVKRWHALHTLAVLATGAWWSPFAFSLLPSALLAGFTRGHRFALRLTLVAAAVEMGAKIISDGALGLAIAQHHLVLAEALGVRVLLVDHEHLLAVFVRPDIDVGVHVVVILAVLVEDLHDRVH